MAETEQQKTRLCNERWLVNWDYGSDSANALIYQNAAGSRIWYAIATIEDVPVDEHTGELVRDGADADRLQEVCLIAHAPDLLDAVRQAALALEEITGLNRPDAECGTWINDKETERVWRKLCEIQHRLDCVYYDAHDTDSV